MATISTLEQHLSELEAASAPLVRAMETTKQGLNTHEATARRTNGNSGEIPLTFGARANSAFVPSVEPVSEEPEASAAKRGRGNMDEAFAGAAAQQSAVLPHKVSSGASASTDSAVGLQAGGAHHPMAPPPVATPFETGPLEPGSCFEPGTGQGLSFASDKPVPFKPQSAPVQPPVGPASSNPFVPSVAPGISRE